jgi:hypothetical protein
VFVTKDSVPLQHGVLQALRCLGLGSRRNAMNESCKRGRQRSAKWLRPSRDRMSQERCTP